MARKNHDMNTSYSIPQTWAAFAVLGRENQIVFSRDFCRNS